MFIASSMKIGDLWVEGSVAISKPSFKKCGVVGVMYYVCEIQLKIYFAATAICHKLNIQEMCGLKLQSLTY
jgi:hypothetical protein